MRDSRYKLSLFVEFLPPGRAIYIVYKNLAMTHFQRFLSIVEAPPPKAVIVESDFVVILAAPLCALICMASANKGLKKKVLQSFPKVTYKYNKDAAKFASMECAIRLGEFADRDEIRVLPQYGHGFHMGYVDIWLGSHFSCPSSSDTGCD
ncbi:hypothetical protein CRYUN_Cryun15aG0155200 [Craigia yunnanensis]